MGHRAVAPLTLLAGEGDDGAWFAEVLCFASKGERTRPPVCCPCHRTPRACLQPFILVALAGET